MNKPWIILIILCILTLLGMGVYEIYNSMTGGNVTFTKTVNPISSDLGSPVLKLINNSQDKILIQDKEIEGK